MNHRAKCAKASEAKRAIERLAVELIDRLPDSRETRRELLRAVRIALPELSAIRARAALMLALMERLDAEQRDLVTEFRSNLQNEMQNRICPRTTRKPGRKGRE